MNQRVRSQLSSRQRLRVSALAGGSLMAHAVILGFLSLKVVEVDRRYGAAPPLPPPYSDGPIYLEIEPRVLMPGEAVRSTQSAPAVRPSPSSAVPGSRAPSPGQPAPEAPADFPDAPRPRQAAGVGPVAGDAAPGAAAAGSAVWRVRPQTLGEAIGRGLRTRLPGCANRAGLSPAELAVCDDRFGERAAAAPPIGGTGDAERDARFAREGARALSRYEARRRPLSGGVGVVGPQDGPGSNFGTGVAGAHLDPSLRPDATGPIRTRRDGSRASGPPLVPGAASPRD